LKAQAFQIGQKYNYFTLLAKKIKLAEKVHLGHEVESELV
jgi:hypothetical protein